MKRARIILLAYGLLFSFISAAQDKAKENLSRNLESIQELQELLSNDFNPISETKTIVPGKAFVFSNTMVFNSFGDESAKHQAKAIETEFGTTFNGSLWKFQLLDNQNGSQQLEVSTVSGEKQMATYSCSGAMVMSGTLINGMDFQAYLFQSKKDAKAFVMLFGIANGIVLAADFMMSN
jgi:hypothetical protein